MESVREAGWEAFRQGSADEAVRLLTLVCRQDPTDYEAHIGLGTALGKAGRHEEAITTLTAAVRLRPASAQARYNLGVAMEQAGYAPEAVDAFQQAVALDPDYLKAGEALQRLQQIPQIPRAPVVMTTAHSAQADGPGWQAPHPQPAPFPTHGGHISDTEALASDTDGPGFVATPHAESTLALPDHGLLSGYSPSPHAPAGPTAIPDAAPSELPPPNFNDEIDIPKAFREFWRVLVTPNAFFREQAGRLGMMSPILLVGVYLAIELICGFISNGLQSVIGFAVQMVFSPVALAVSGAWMVAMYLLTALFVHFLGCIFGNRQDFSMSFRACVYADAPRFLISILVTLFMTFFVLPSIRAHPVSQADVEHALGLPAGTTASRGAGYTPSRSSYSTPSSDGGNRGAETTSPAPITLPPHPTPVMLVGLAGLFWRKYGAILLSSVIFSAVGWLWSTALLVLAIHRLQQISLEAAFGVVFLMYALAILVVALVIFGFAGVVFALIGSALHAAGAGGGLHH